METHSNLYEMFKVMRRAVDWLIELKCLFKPTEGGKVELAASSVKMLLQITCYSLV